LPQLHLQIAIVTHDSHIELTSHFNCPITAAAVPPASRIGEQQDYFR